MIDLDGIKKDDYLIIKGVKKRIIAKVEYVSEKAPDDVYYKIILDDQSVLVTTLKQDSIYLGTVILPLLDYSPPFPEEIWYKGNTYSLITRDYQIVKEICFGNPLYTEGEVRYADYSSDDKTINSYISLAVVSRTNERADILAQYLKETDLRLEKYDV